MPTDPTYCEIYGATAFVISALISVMWRVIVLDRDLLKPEVSDQEINAIQRVATPNLVFYLGVIVLAIFAPRVAAFGFLVIAIIAVMRVRGDQLAPPLTGSSPNDGLKPADIPTLHGCQTREDGARPGPLGRAVAR